MNALKVMELAKELLLIDSPTGYTKAVIDFYEKEVKALGYETIHTNKGNLIVKVPGIGHHTKALCAHVDTLGLMVRSIKEDGTLAFTLVGGPIVPTLDGEYCKIVTRDGRTYTGTILSNSPSAHVYDDSKNAPRTDMTMHVRIDECVSSKKEVEELGIMPGDYICIDPKTTITPSGFIKSRFLDDKLSVAILYGLIKTMKEEFIIPHDTWYFLISTYEEVGHGCAYIPEEIEEVIAVDMGCIGKDLSCTERDVSICAKDSSGPYDYQMTTKLINLAKDNELSYAVDIYPFYSSDVSASLRGGQDIRGALIGPGVAASHGMERSHVDAVENTMKLLIAYMTKKD